MGVSKFQNTGRPKYRVVRKVGDTYVQHYFPRTRQGYRDAKACDAELYRLHRENPQAPGSHWSTKERSHKQFNTGVVGITLKAEMRERENGIYPTIQWLVVASVKNKPAILHAASDGTAMKILGGKPVNNYGAGGAGHSIARQYRHHQTNVRPSALHAPTDYPPTFWIFNTPQLNSEITHD